jgi:hypothetical protein
MVGKTRPLYLKRVRTVDRHINQAIVPTIRRAYRSSGTRTDHQVSATSNRRAYRSSGERTAHQAPASKVNLKKQGKFRANSSVTVESVLQGHQKSVKLARPE